MAVSRLKDGRWIVYGQPGYWPEDPKRTREYIGRGDDSEIRARARDAQLGKRPKPRYGGMLFDELAEAYFETAEGRMQPATLNSLKYTVERLIKAFGSYRAVDITPEVVDKYVSIRKRTVTSTTANGDVTYLKAILSWGANSMRRKIPFDPLSGYKKPARDDARIMPPTSDELIAIIKHAATHLKRALLVSYFTGVRPGPVELYSLRFSDVDWSRQAIYIRGARKGGPAVRLIPLHGYLFDCLACWYEDDLPNPDLIIHYRGKPVEKIKTAFANAKRLAGITRRMRPYDFRHANITSLLLSGVDPRTASELAGHSRPDTTTRVYTHSNLDAATKAVGMLINPFKTD